MVEGLYGCTLERNPYECCILIEFGFREVWGSNMQNTCSFKPIPVSSTSTAPMPPPATKNSCNAVPAS